MYSIKDISNKKIRKNIKDISDNLDIIFKNVRFYSDLEADIRFYSDLEADIYNDIFKYSLLGIKRVNRITIDNGVFIYKNGLNVGLKSFENIFSDMIRDYYSYDTIRDISRT